jgi:hypothetical protein
METGITGSSNTHARLSPSDSKRWSNCLASIAFQEANAHRVRRDDGSVYASEGEEAHEWCAKVLLKQCTIDEVPETGMLDNELRIHVKAYVEHCLAAIPEGSSYEVEVQTPLFYQTEQTGTCDFACVTEERVVIRDYKNGGGVLVTSAENTQLAIYAFSLIKLFEDVFAFSPDTVVDISVFQPRHREGSEQQPWVITLAELTKFCEDIEYKAIQARTGAERVREKIGAPGRDVSPEEILEAAPGLVFHPEEGDGGSCRWCKVKSFCGKRLAASLDDLDTPVLNAEEMLAVMPDLDKKESKLPVDERVALTAERLGLTSLGDDYLVRLYRAKKGITTFLDDIEEYLEARLLEGEEIEGTKLVAGREGNRAWANETEADTFLKGQGLKQEDRYDFKLKSPSKIEVALSDKLKTVTRTKNRFNELVTRSPARRVIALDTDKRPAVTSCISAMPDLDEPAFE